MPPVRIIRLAALALAVLPGCRHETRQAPPLPVTVQAVAGGLSESGVRYSASIRPKAQVDLAFKVGGYIEQILQVRGVDGHPRNAQDGDYVRRGTVLARVRDREFRDALAQARAALSQAKADFDRVSQLYENRSVSKADYDAAYARYTANRAQEDQATQSLADCSLRAPLDGHVLKRSIEVGSLVAAGTPAFSIGDLRSVEVVFGVPDVQVGAMKMGAPQAVNVDAVPGQSFRGQITRVAQSADPSSRVFEVEVTLPNPDGRLRSGMIASLQIAGAAAAPSGAFIPLNAVVRPPGETAGYAVYVVESQGGRELARLRRIKLGEIRGDLIEVASGLKGGERVIVRGATLAVDAREVRIIP
jgi:RND family efflux transporter MFP subunit